MSVIDAFIFAWELDVLEVRLRELDQVADKFVIVESLQAHGSDDVKKEPVLPANWEVIRPFEHKVKYVLLDRLEPPFGDRSSPWPRENFHRSAIMGAVAECGPSDGDLLMVSDCDEIPRAETVLASMARLRQGPCALSQDLFYYNVNSYMGKWNGTVAGTVSAILGMGGAQAARNKRDGLPSIADGGWHMSYFGGLDRVLHKARNFAHAQEDIARLLCCRDPEAVGEDILAGRDLYRFLDPSRLDRVERRASDDPRLPSWLRENIGRFRRFTEDGLKEQL